MKTNDLKFNAFWLFLFVLLLIGFFMLSCKKDKSEPVNQVISSEWKVAAAWTVSATSTGAGKSTFYYDIDAPELTQEIVDRGTVLVYAKFTADPDGSNQVKLLPSIYYNLGGASTQYRFQQSISLGKIRVICDVIPTGIPSNTNQFRYVVLPQGAAQVANVDVNNYVALRQAYQLTD